MPLSSDSQHRDIDIELEHRILLGIALEWRTALWVLPPKTARSMKPPVFTLKDGNRTLAHWNVEKREIAFSRTFVRNAPWDSIREVLIHEMAHQYASEILNITGEAPHGPGFLAACAVLKANPRASGTYPPLSERMTNDGANSHDRIMIRIRKLLALGESGNRHEAESALSKARHLIRKYNVDLSSTDPDNDFISVFVGEPRLRHRREDYTLARLLVDEFSVFGIWVNAYVLDRGKMGRVFEISGRSVHVKTAVYAWHFITRHIDRAWTDYNVDKGLNRSRKTDFATGLIGGFKSTLSEADAETQKKDRSQDKTLPVLQGDPALDIYVAERYPRVTRFRRPGIRYDAGVTRDGTEAGRKLNLPKGIETDGQPRVLPLPFPPSSP